MCYNKLKTLMLWIIKMFIFNRYASANTVKVKIVDKFKKNMVPKHTEIYEQKCYAAVFETMIIRLLVFSKFLSRLDKSKNFVE